MQNANKTRGTGPLGGAGLVGLWGASSLIKSIQRGTITISSGSSGTATINTVVPDNCIVVHLQASSTQAVQPNLTVWFSAATLTNATTVTATWGVVVASTTCSFEVIEFMPGVVKSRQTGTIILTGGSESSDTATISAVDMAKAICSMPGQNTGTGGSATADELLKLVFTNATTITASRGAVGAAFATNTAYFQVMEFF